MIDDPRIASIPIESEWIDEAAEELHGYKDDPVIQTFLRRHGFRPSHFSTVKDEIEHVKSCIRSLEHPLRLDDLVSYLDEIKLHGRQFIFCWRLEEGEEGYLAQLRGAGGPERDRLVWRSDIPELARVRRPGPDDPPHLILKWVATRSYYVLESDPDNPTAAPVPVPRHQRAVTYFILDLSTGDCELRIQSLPNEGETLPTQRQELERYRAEVERYVDLDRFSPVRIEPVAKSWLTESPLLRLTEPDLQVRGWTVVRPDGRFLTAGGTGGALFPKLLPILGTFFVRRLTLRWKCEQRVVGNSLFFTLDGFADMVDFNGTADAQRVDFILDRIRKEQPPELRMKELRELVERHPEHGRIFAAMDHAFMTKSRMRVTLGDLKKVLWYPQETILEVMRLAAREQPGMFTLVGKRRETLEMNNRLRVNQGGLVDMLRRSADGKGRTGAKELVKPALTVGFLLSVVLLKELSTWLVGVVFENLSGIPFDVARFSFLGLLVIANAALTYGSASVQSFVGRLLKLAWGVAQWISGIRGEEGPGPAQGLEAVYRKWLANTPAADRLRPAAAAAPG